MDFQVGEVIKMKKPHPCGANEWKLIRVGMDFRLQCNGCGRQVMLPRKQWRKISGDMYRQSPRSERKRRGAETVWITGISL